MINQCQINLFMTSENQIENKTKNLILNEFFINANKQIERNNQIIACTTHELRNPHSSIVFFLEKV